MPFEVMIIVLFGAGLHATWNAMLKSATDKQLDSAVLVGMSGLLAAPFLIFLPLPLPEAWPFLASSAAIHQVYFWLVNATYRHGDLSFGYPLMRGAAPLLVALASGSMVHEQLSGMAWLGITLICGGILAMAANGLRQSRSAIEPAAYALANAAVIAVYTLVDGAGVRLAGSAAAYVLWLFVLLAIPYVGIAFLFRRRALIDHARQNWQKGSIGALCSIGSYGAALWAMTLAPMALVAALRETSIVIATLIGGLLLKEKFGNDRYIAAIAAAAGAVLLRLA